MKTTEQLINELDELIEKDYQEAVNQLEEFKDETQKILEENQLISLSLLNEHHGENKEYSI